MTTAIVPKELLTATLGGLSLLVVSGGTDRQVLTQQADGTYAPEAVSAGIGGSVGSKDNRLVKSSGTGGSTVTSTGITVADTTNNVSGMGTLACGSITTSGDILITNGVISYGADKRFICGAAGTPLRFVFTSAADGDITVAAMTASTLIKAGTYTVSTLPSASANAYKFANVSDSSVTTFGSTVAGGGSSKVQVFSNGTNWTVCAV